MSHWETGRQAPSVWNLPVLAAVLGCQVDEFFPEQDAEQKVARSKRTSSKAVA